LAITTRSEYDTIIRVDNSIRRCVMTRASSWIALLVMLSAATVGFGQAESPPKVTDDGLVLVEDREVAVAWVRPDVDFSVFDKAVVPAIQVSFIDGWEIENRVSAQDSKRIREGFGEFYRKSLVEILEKEAKLEVVEEEGDGVLRFKCVVVKLEMTAAENMDVGRSRNLMSSMGSAVLAVEVFDSAKGYVHARVLDPLRVFSTGLRNFGGQQENGAEARRVFRGVVKALGR
jgi:hypothetical protein